MEAVNRGVNNELVRLGGVPFGREGSIEVRQRELLIQMSGDQAQPLRGLFGRQLFRYAGNARGVQEIEVDIGDRRVVR